MTIENQNMENNMTPISKKPKLSKALDEHITRDEQEARQQATSFTGSALHQSIISPIHMANLPLSILEHIQQHANSVITSLPNSSITTITPNDMDYHQTITSSNNLTSTPDNNNTKTDEKAKGLTADEKRQRRLLRNRLAAKDCRKKKKEYIKQMEQTITRLEKEKEELNDKIVELKANATLIPSNDQMMMNSDDNYRLIKEVGELNAKLGNMK
ncbi:hypothetical protein EDC94DRAFT_588357 [Helicostylum pulchrum]|uniref:BZIP domain-containing protein n=1 Tax=Helicostylum pulchrum TaxID=562976 RepID=A0ABP9YH19_9FUNG|nr:hypothetical protein EDC94DRAFT_588357 [Helicostylum pulchrum]